MSRLPRQTSIVSVPAYEDGLLLKALLTVPSEEAEKTYPDGPVVVMAAATAVPCRFYLPFLCYLAEQGIASITLDWRGTHSNLEGSMSESRATVFDWGMKDLAGVIEYISTKYPKRKLVHIGHSVGGHVMPLPHNAHLISHAITVGTQNAFYPLTPFRSRHQIFWNVAVPAASSIFGYFPGSRLKIVGDLPATVMQSWRSWANKPFYVASMSPLTEERYKSFKGPVLAISVDDDEYATRLGVQLHHQQLSSKVQFWHLDHNDMPSKLPIKHVGFFFSHHGKILWPQTLSFLRSGELPSIDALQPHAKPEKDMLCRL